MMPLGTHMSYAAAVGCRSHACPIPSLKAVNLSVRRRRPWTLEATVHRYAVATNAPACFFGFWCGIDLRSLLFHTWQLPNLSTTNLHSPSVGAALGHPKQKIKNKFRYLPYSTLRIALISNGLREGFVLAWRGRPGNAFGWRRQPVQ